MTPVTLLIWKTEWKFKFVIDHALFLPDTLAGFYMKWAVVNTFTALPCSSPWPFFVPVMAHSHPQDIINGTHLYFHGSVPFR